MAGCWSAILSLVLFSTCYAHADNLAQIQSRLNKSTAMEGQFSQEKHISILKRPLVAKGLFYVVPTIGIVWEVVSPAPSTLIITGSDIRFTESTSEKTKISMRYIGNILTSIFTGNLQELLEQFDIESINSNKEGEWQLILVPKSGVMKKALSSIILKGGIDVKQVNLQESSGDFTLISLTNLKHYPKTPENIERLFDEVVPD